LPDTLREQLHRLIEQTIPAGAPPIPGDVTAQELLEVLGTHGAGTSLADAGLLAAVLPDTSGRLADRVGPCYRTNQLVRLLPESGAAITDEAVRARRESGRLIGLRTRDRRWLYPAWQFRTRPGRLEVRADVLDLWQLLGHADDAWSRAAWLTGPRADLAGESPLGWLDRHGLDRGLRAAAGDRRRRAAA
jgi:hypothetical protein